VAKSWEQFNTFKETLIARGSFCANTVASQRIYYKGAGAAWEIPVDIIPFEPIASEDRRIAWPPERDIVMNVAGFDEALRAAVLISVEKDLVVRVASLPGLTILKLLAWYDRRNETRKDASDLYTLLATYANAGNNDRLYTNELDLLENVGYDLDLAGAQLLGHDVAHICEDRSLRRIEEILGSDRLAGDLLSHINQDCDPFEEYPNRAETLLDYFRRGVAEKRVRHNRDS